MPTDDGTMAAHARARKTERLLHRRLDRLETHLPARFAAWVDRLRKPGAVWVRIPLGILLVLGGIFSFLPVLGLWMLPIGLVFLAIDLPFLRRPTAWMLVWGERQLRKLRRWWHRRRGA